MSSFYIRLTQLTIILYLLKSKYINLIDPRVYTLFILIGVLIYLYNMLIK